MVDGKSEATVETTFTSFPPGPGTSSGPRLMTPYLSEQRFLAPPSRFPVSASHTTARTCARPRTTSDEPLITTPSWSTVSNHTHEHVHRFHFFQTVREDRGAPDPQSRFQENPEFVHPERSNCHIRTVFSFHGLLVN